MNEFVRGVRPRAAALLAVVAALSSACSSKKKGSPGPTTIDVHGKVVFLDSNLGVQGLAVLTSGQNAVTTAADGTFTFTGVKTPYTLTVLDSTNKYGEVFVGLTRTDPVLPDVIGVPTGNSATIAGTITGVTPGGDYLYGTSTLGGSASGTVDSGTGAMTGSCSWNGPSTDTFTLWGVGYDASTQHVIAAGSTTLTATNGVAQNSVSLAMAAVTPVPFSLTITGAPADAGSYPGGANVYLSDANSPFAAILGGASVSSNATVVVSQPRVPGAGITALAEFLHGPHEVTIAYGVTGSSVTLPVNPPLIQAVPVDAATGVTVATPFSWSAEPSPAVYQIYFSPTSIGPPAYVVYTTATTTTIPDLSLAGLGLPSAQGYLWQVISSGPYPSLDDYVVPYVPPTSGTQFGDMSVGRTFITQ